MHPTFICIGAQKAGTDWFYDQFAAHKDFWMPPIKEIAFFDKGFGPSRIKKANRQIRWKRIKHEEKKADYALDIEFLETMLGAEPDFRNYDFQVYFDLFDGKPGAPAIAPRVIAVSMWTWPVKCSGKCLKPFSCWPSATRQSESGARP